MEAKTLSPNLEENLTYFTGRFQNAMDLMVRRVELSGRKAAMIAIDGLVNKETITLSLLEPLLKTEGYPDQPEAMVDFIESQVLSAADLRRERRMDKLLTLLMSGFVLLCVDGSGEGLVSGVQGFAYRSPQEPQNEVMQRGAKDGFTESNQLNMAMIRRRMKSTSLKFEPLEAGSESHTPVVLCYLEGAAAPGVLDKVRRVVAQCPLKTLLGAGYLTGFLERGNVFSGVGLTERPDVVCGKLAEGRVALLVEGTPSAILLPFLFVENFQTLDDYLTRPYYGTFIRWLKYIAFFLSAFLPGAYVAVIVHHPEMLPESLLMKIARAQAQTPFPVMFETLTLYFLYEVLREAGLRAPRSLSATVSIVGGLVLGDTAVAAGLVSAPSLLVVALTAIAGYAVPRLYEPLSLLRLAFLLIGNFLGIWGVMAGLVFLLLDLCGAESFGVPLLSPLSPYRGNLVWRDVFFRAGWRRMSRHNALVRDMPGSQEHGEEGSCGT